MSDQGTGQPLALPSGATTDPVANGRHKGQMPRWATASATIASFATRAVAGHSDVYVPLATASLAGAMSAADNAKLASMEVPVTRLTYNEATDVLSAAAIAANTQTQVVANQTFAVNSLTSFLLIVVRASVSVTGVNLTNWGLRLNIDGGALTAKLSGAIHVANGFDSLTGGVVLVAGLAAGNHTIKLELIASAAGTAYCRASTQPNFEFASIQIEEMAP